ncbi:hypothetical protein SNEBB_004419 [Seison nebaliae]|nr:hypothetical protein SNEBB_004419 [Seison nebaliae]
MLSIGLWSHLVPDGDITPDIWVSKLFVSCMIVVAVLVTPLRIEKLINLLREERSRGRGVNTSELLYHPHVVVIIPILKLEQVEKFITDFFNGYEIHSTFRIVFLCKSPISSALRIILNILKWSESLIWATGSAFSEKDLERVSLKEAKAVFILPSTGIIGVDKD